MSDKKYSIGVDNDQPFIRCNICKVASYKQSDIMNLYCDNCKKFHGAFPLVMAAMCLLNAPDEELGEPTWTHLRDNLNKRFDDAMKGH